MKPIRIISLCALACIFLGCSADQQMEHIKNIEKKGRFYNAWEKYQEFAASHPQNARAPEAIFRAGLVAQQRFNDCFMASTFYDDVLTRYPDSEPWARAAQLQKNNCPDYFPLIVGSTWTEVDSDTKGKNARVEITCENATDDPKILPSQAGKLEKIYYAGGKKSLTQDLFYKKDQSELQETKSWGAADKRLLLKWPIEVGTRWSVMEEGRLFNYEIASVDRTVSVAAGDFEACIHVRSYATGDNAIKNEYYAPGVGRILTSVTSKKGEKRILELSSYSVPAAPEFVREGNRP